MILCKHTAPYRLTDVIDVISSFLQMHLRTTLCLYWGSEYRSGSLLCAMVRSWPFVICRLLHFVRTNDKTVKHCCIFQLFCLFSVCSCLNLLMTWPKEPKCSNTRHMRKVTSLTGQMCLGTYVLFDWSEWKCGKIPAKLREENNERRKRQQTTRPFAIRRSRGGWFSPNSHSSSSSRLWSRSNRSGTGFRVHIGQRGTWVRSPHLHLPEQSAQRWKTYSGAVRSSWMRRA